MAGSSNSYLNPELKAALDAGQTYEQWLNGRIPGVDYARISADQAARSSTKAKVRDIGEGIGNQHRRNVRVAGEHNIAIVRFYEDNDITAAVPDIERPAFLEMSRHLLHRKTPEGLYVCACVAVEYERVWRLPEDYIRFRRAVITESDGVFIERGKPYDLYSVGGNILGLVNSGVSEGEVQKTKERLNRSVEDRATTGKVHGGSRRFGWLGPDLREGRKVNEKLHPEEKVILRHMIEQRLEGKAWGTIADERNRAGTFGAKGALWTASSVRQILINPAICGYRELRGELVMDPKSDPADPQPLVGTWETIATPEEWRMLRESTKANGATKMSRYRKESSQRIPPEARARKYLFSGFLKCGAKRKDNGHICMSALGGQKQPTKRRPDKKLYVCNSVGCMSIGRDMDPVDRFLEELVLTALERKYKKAAPKTAPWEGWERLEMLRNKLKTHEAKWMDGEIDDDTFYRYLPDLKDSIAALEEDKQEYEARQASENSWIGWDRSRWEDMDLLQKRLAIGKIIEAVIVLPIPPGRAKRAPFDANLLKVIPKAS